MSNVKKFSVVTAEEIDEEHVDRFLRQHFSGAKCDFLRDNGLWRHRGNQNRMIVINDDEEIVGYCAAIPSPFWLQGQEIQGRFWVDLYVPPKWRGHGIQSLTDQAIREMEGLSIGFCNKAVVPIHRKHGWGIREASQVMMMPLVPPKVFQVHITQGWKGSALRLLAWLLSPFSFSWRVWLKNYKPSSARIVKNPDLESMAEAFRSNRKGWLTTNRTAEQLRWRYVDSPHRQQYTFFAVGPKTTPSLIAISRTFVRRGVKVTRVLDIFGDLTDRQRFSELLRLIAQEAAQKGSSQVTAMASDPVVASVLRANGFLFSVDARFRWFSPNPEIMEIARKSRCHWVLGDSDNDTID